MTTRKNKIRLFDIALCALLCLAGEAAAVSRGLDRVSVESAHFSVAVDRAKKATADEAAAWLEQAYAFQETFLEHRVEEKIRVVLLDDEDYANGYALAAQAWIGIYLPPARFDLRGPARWMPNVSAHELAHVVTLRKMGAAPRFLGVDAFVTLGQRHGRADAEAAWTPHQAPAWLAEGLAQYVAMRGGHDTLDAHRTMLLRQAWLSGSLMPLKAMETFSGDARDGELVYNQGFHFVDFLYRTRGREAMNAMMDAWRAKGYNGSFWSAFGASPATLYDAWRRELDERFGAEGAGPAAGSESRGAFGPSYTIAGSPWRDSATKTLYYVSSRANDFGITHLYAQQDGEGDGSARLVRRDVSPTLRRGAKGTILFASSRIERSSGARISDLYRLSPRTGLIQRLTTGRRATVGVEWRGTLFALVQDKGRPRLARLSRTGRVARAWDAPAGTEFTDLVASDSGAYAGLHLVVVRGKNADIARLDTATGALTPVAASEAREIDPFVREDRLYYAADLDGAYALYSRGTAGDLIRHTEPGKPAFAPVADATSLSYVEYAAEGFRVRSLSMTNARTTGVPATEPPSAVSDSFVPPPAPALKRYKYDRSGMGFLGYSARLGYAFTPHVDVGSLFGEESDYGGYRLNPCGPKAYMGGDAYVSEPSMRSLLAFSVLAGQCLERAPGEGTEVTGATIAYLNQNGTTDMMGILDYRSANVDRLDGYENPSGKTHEIMGMAMWQYRLGNYAYILPAFGVGVAFADIPRSGNPVLGGPIASATFGFEVLEPGKDFVNQGVYGDFSVINIAVLGAKAGGYANVARAFFLGLHGDVLLPLPAPEFVDAGWSATADYRIPLGLRLGSAGYRGLFLESMFLRAGFSQRFNYDADVALATDPSFLSVRAADVSLASYVVYWDALWQAPPESPKDGYFAVSLSL
jgi:hypothetical protein